MSAVPSDQSSAITQHGTSSVRACVLSLSARSPDGIDADYIEWHALDHLPEQYRIVGLRAGTRWVSTPACRAVRAVDGTHLDPADHVVQYLFANPVAPALEHFFGLGADLRAAGRMPLALPSVELAGYELVDTRAARRILVGADVLPWRPARGVYLLLEEGGLAPIQLLDMPGVAGFWRYHGDDGMHQRFAATTGRRLTVCYLDDDPVVVAERLKGVVVERWRDGSVTPLLAAPFLAIEPGHWNVALP